MRIHDNGKLGMLAAVCLIGCSGGTGTRSPKVGMDTPAASNVKEKEMTKEVSTFLSDYQTRFAALDRASALSYWKAANSGAKADFDAYADAELALKTFHSDKTIYEKTMTFLESGAVTDPLLKRQLEIALLDAKGLQLPKETIEQMVDAQAEIELAFNTFRGVLDGKALTNNALLVKLKDETKSVGRKKIWEALKQVGAEVSEKLIALAELRNSAARSLGYADYFEMQIALQEHDLKTLEEIFDKLETLTEAPYAAIKQTLDRELAEKFGITPEEIRPWHYDNPFFQAPPPSKAVDPDIFYDHFEKEAIMPMAQTFYRDIGLPVDAVVANSDLYEREGKDQHAFCISIDKKKDVRTLLNITPSANWMDTSLHEEGHAVYDINIDESLPFNLREASHIFTTEGIAMMFGALAYNPTWLTAYAEADPKKVEALGPALLEQRRREQLIFARWAMVMFHFERALYRDPKQDLNTLWWDLVERFQTIPRPKGRNAPDWASKPHFTIAPVYYHNYLLGEVFAAQLRHVLATMAGHEGSTATLSFKGRTDFGDLLKQRVFAPGRTEPWPKFVVSATGEPLSVTYYAAEVTR